MIVVSALDHAAELVRTRPILYALSLLGPDTAPPVFQELGPGRHKCLVFNDIAEPADGMVAPSPDHVTDIIDFIDLWGGEGEILIHCLAGVSRSTAAAYIGNCLLNPQENEADMAAELRSRSATATPNRLMIEHADHLMRRDGRMISAVAGIGRGAEFEGGRFFEWEVKR